MTKRAVTRNYCLCDDFYHKVYRHSMKITKELSVPAAVIRMADCLDRRGSSGKHLLSVIVLHICTV